MLQTLLVPLDGSGFGEESLPWARTLARCSGADVAVAHVHVPHVPDHLLANTQYQYEGVDLKEYDHQDHVEEETYLQGVAERLARELGREVQPVLLEGEVTEAIDRFAGRSGPGMIVMTTHGRSGFDRVVLGSVADAVVRNAPWPVLLIRSRGKEPGAAEDIRLRRILVPLDGSEGSERILPHAAELARDAGAQLELLRVVVPGSIMGSGMLPVSMAARAEARRSARAYLEEVAERLHPTGLEVSVRVEEHAHSTRGILETMRGERPDLVAMATHGYGMLARAVLGSVADQLLRRSDVPLLLVGPGAEA